MSEEDYMVNNENKSFWTTIPGILTAIAAVITACAGLIAVIATLPRPNPFFPATETPLASTAEPPTQAPTQAPPPTDTPTLTYTPTPEPVMRALVLKDGDDFKPDLAISWEPSDDGITWSFTLMRDVRMEDGTILTATTVQKKLEAWAPVRLGYVGITPIDNYTFVIELLVPTDNFNLFDELSKIEFATSQ